MPYLKRQLTESEPIDCRILSAALDLFVRKGYHGVSIHEIQKQANVSIGSIYNHFGGKEGIAFELFTHILGEIEELVDDAISEGATPRAQCEIIIRDLFRYTETHRDIIAFVFHAKHVEFLPEAPHACDSAPFVKMRGIVSAGMELGEFQPLDPWVGASVVFGAMIRMIQLRLEGKIEKPLPEYLEQVIEASWRGICHSKPGSG